MSYDYAAEGDHTNNYSNEEEEAYTRPEGMSAKQDEIIQHVAKYVTNSCDSAKYQAMLRQRTKYNPLFQFLLPEHRYSMHYQYLLKSYAYWKAMDVADAGASNAGEEAMAYYQQQIRAEQQQQEQRASYSNAYMENNNNNNYNNNNNNISEEDPTAASWGIMGGGYTMPANSDVRYNSNNNSNNAAQYQQQQQQQLPMEAEDNYEEYVYENGVLVPKAS